MLVITLYQFHLSPYCDKVRRILHYKGQPYRTEEVPLLQAPMRTRKLSHAGKLPVIEHEGRLVADSTDIAVYLEERFPAPALIPAEPRDRALCHLIEDWADESLHFFELRICVGMAENRKMWMPHLVKYDMAAFRPLTALVASRMLRRKAAVQGLGKKSDEQVVQELGRHLDAIAGWLGERPWLVGEALSLADIAVMSQLSPIRSTRAGGEEVGKRAVVAAWMDRVEKATKPAAA